MDKRPFVSVVIVNYNGEPFLEKCLQSVLQTEYPNFEVVLLDNASKDRSLEIIDRKFNGDSHLKLTFSDKNYGFAMGNNLGVSYIKATSEFVAFISNDVEVEPDWLSELVKAARSDPRVGAVQCKVLLQGNRRLIDSTGHFLDFVGYTYQRGEDEVDNGQYDNERESDIFYAYGAAFIVPMKVIRQVMASGFLFDPDYFCYHEDADLCWRIRLLGYGITYAPKSVVYHHKGATSMRHGIPPFIVFHHTKNRVTSLIKNYSLLNLAKFLFPSLLIEVSRAAATMRVESSHSVATLRAIMWVGKNFRRIWRKRALVQNYVRKVPDKEITKYLFGPQLFYNFRKFKKYSGNFIGS